MKLYFTSYIYGIIDPGIIAALYCRVKNYVRLWQRVCARVCFCACVTFYDTLILITTYQRSFGKQFSEEAISFFSFFRSIVQYLIEQFPVLNLKFAGMSPPLKSSKKRDAYEKCNNFLLSSYTLSSRHLSLSSCFSVEMKYFSRGTTSALMRRRWKYFNLTLYAHTSCMSERPEAARTWPPSRLSI